MNMNGWKYCMKSLLLLGLFAIGINVQAWEINTHRAIDQSAISRDSDSAKNLQYFVENNQLDKDYSNARYEGYTLTNGTPATYFSYITSVAYGEKYGVSKWNQSFSSQHNYQDLIEAGTILEDASTSMHLDFQNGSRTELETLCGYVVREGKRLHLPTPMMAKIYGVLKEKTHQLRQ